MKNIGLLLVVLLLLNCQSQKANLPEVNWDQIIRDIEIIVTSGLPDSVKSRQIRATFDRHQISLEDYQKFYELHTGKSPEKNAAFLKEVENTISQEMKEETTRQRKMMDGMDIPIKRKPDPRSREKITDDTLKIR